MLTITRIYYDYDRKSISKLKQRNTRKRWIQTLAKFAKTHVHIYIHCIAKRALSSNIRLNLYKDKGKVVLKEEAYVEFYIRSICQFGTICCFTDIQVSVMFCMFSTFQHGVDLATTAYL